MRYHWFRSFRGIIITPLLLALVFIVACGSAAEPVSDQQAPVATAVPAVQAAPAATPVPTATPKKVEEASAKAQAEAQQTAKAVADPDLNPIYGGTINMAQYADVRQRLIHQSSVLNMNLAPVFNNLVQFNPETADPSDLQCDLCSSWELADDGVTYTFKIHPDATWHDGVPVTADDLVFSFESMVNPDQFKVLEGRSTSSHVNTGLYFTSGNSRAIDDKTFELTTDFPSGGFLLAIANRTAPIIPRHTVVDQEIAQGGKDVTVLNGSGPFKLVDFVKEVSVTYEADPNYWKTDRNGNKYPYIDGMKHFIITDSGRLIAAFKTEQVLTSNRTLDNLTAQEALQLDKDADNLTVHWTGPAQAYYVWMNTTKAPFNDRRVRHAISLALHRQPIIQTFSGGTDSGGYPNPDGFWYSNTPEEYANMPGFRELNGEKHPDDIAEAQRLVAEAGLGDGVEVTLTARGVLGYPDLAIQVKEQLREVLGWDITIQVMESGAGFDAYWAGDTTFAIQSGGIFSTGPDAIWARLTRGTVPQWTGGGRGKYFTACGADGVCLDELNDIQTRILDREERKVVLQQMSDIVVNYDTASPYLFWANHHQVVNNKIQNYNMTLQASRWEHVWCDPAC